MIEITLNQDGARDLREIADLLEQSIDDVLTAIGEELTGYIMEDFETKSRGGVGEGGIQWAPLDPRTIAKKAKRAKGGDTSTQIGVDTGLMRMSIQPLTPDLDGKGGSIFKIEGNQVSVGFGRHYAKYFDEGRPAKISNRRSVSKMNLEEHGLPSKRVSENQAVSPLMPRGQPARPLIPDEIPAEWHKAAEEIVEEWITHLFESREK